MGEQTDDPDYPIEAVLARKRNGGGEGATEAPRQGWKRNGGPQVGSLCLGLLTIGCCCTHSPTRGFVASNNSVFRYFEIFLKIQKLEYILRYQHGVGIKSFKIDKFMRMKIAHDTVKGAYNFKGPYD